MAPKAPKTQIIRNAQSKKKINMTLLIQRVKGIKTRNRKPKTLREIFFTRYPDIVNELRSKNATYEDIWKYLKKYHNFKPSKQYCEALLREFLNNKQT